MSSNKVKLKSIDNKIFEVPVYILRKAKLIAEFVDQACEEKKVLLLRVAGAKDLEKIICYLKHYKHFEPKKIPKPFPERTNQKFLRKILNDDWTFNYLQNLSLDEAISLVNSAHYLQIDGLLRILAAKLAYEMCNCDTEEARQKFGIECDMTFDEIMEIENLTED